MERKEEWGLQSVEWRMECEAECRERFVECGDWRVERKME